jgi:uncharacterized protein YdiU (UPF0061 family)
VAGRGLHAWRDEYRQYVHPRPDPRLRPLRLHGSLRPGHICNHTDQQGRYSYANQPQVGHWNCYALGQALLPLIGEVELAQAALDSYQPAFAAKMNALLRAKLGLQTSRDDDTALFDSMLR